MDRVREGKTLQSAPVKHGRRTGSTPKNAAPVTTHACMPRELLLAVTIYLASGCNSQASGHDDDGSADAGDADGGGASGSDASRMCTDAAGHFRLLDDELEGAYLDGWVYERARGLESSKLAAQREGACTVYRLQTCLACSCGGANPCPKLRDVGSVTVSGLREALSVDVPRTASDATDGPRYVRVVQRANPSSDEGTPVVLEASGVADAPFELRATGVGQVTAPEQELVVEAARSLSIEWDPPRLQAGLRMAIELRISERSWIECDVPDTGALQISSELITGLLEERASRTNGITLKRYSAAATELEPGCVDFVVASEITLPVRIPSLIPCTDGVTCPESMVCGNNYVCR